MKSSHAYAVVIYKTMKSGITAEAVIFSMVFYETRHMTDLLGSLICLSTNKYKILFLNSFCWYFINMNDFLGL